MQKYSSIHHSKLPYIFFLFIIVNLIKNSLCQSNIVLKNLDKFYQYIFSLKIAKDCFERYKYCSKCSKHDIKVCYSCKDPYVFDLLNYCVSSCSETKEYFEISSQSCKKMCRLPNEYTSQTTSTCEELIKCPKTINHGITAHSNTINGVYQINQDYFLSHDADYTMFVWRKDNQTFYDMQIHILREKIRDFQNVDKNTIIIIGLQTYIKYNFIEKKVSQIIYLPGKLQFPESPMFWMYDTQQIKYFITFEYSRKSISIINQYDNSINVSISYNSNEEKHQIFKFSNNKFISMTESGEVYLCSLSSQSFQKLFQINKYFRIMENQVNEDFIIGADNMFVYKYVISESKTIKMLDLQGQESISYRCQHLSLVQNSNLILFISYSSIKILKFDNTQTFSQVSLLLQKDCGTDQVCLLYGQLQVYSYFPQNQAENIQYMIEFIHSQQELNKSYTLYELNLKENQLNLKKQFKQQNSYSQCLTKFGQIIQFANNALTLYDTVQDGQDIKERFLYKQLSNDLNQIPGQVIGISQDPFNKIVIKHDKTDQIIDIYNLLNGQFLYQIYVKFPAVNFFENIIIFQSESFEIYIYKLYNKYSQLFKYIQLLVSAIQINYYNNYIYIQQAQSLFVQSKFKQDDLKTFTLNALSKFKFFVNNIYIFRDMNKQELYDENYQILKQNLPNKYSFFLGDPSSLGNYFFYGLGSEIVIFDKNLDILSTVKYSDGTNFMPVFFKMYIEEYTSLVLFTTPKISIFNIQKNTKTEIVISDQDFYINSYIFGSSQSQKIGFLSTTKSQIFVFDMNSYTIQKKFQIPPIQPSNGFIYREYMIGNESPLVKEIKFQLNVTNSIGATQYDFFSNSSSVILNTQATNLIYFSFNNTSKIINVANFNDVQFYRTIISKSLLITSYIANLETIILVINVDVQQDVCSYKIPSEDIFLDVAYLQSDNKLLFLIKVFSMDCKYELKHEIGIQNQIKFQKEIFQNSTEVITTLKDNENDNNYVNVILHNLVNKQSNQYQLIQSSDKDDYIYVKKIYAEILSKTTLIVKSLIYSSEPYNFVILVEELNFIFQLGSHNIFLYKFEQFQMSILNETFPLNEEYKYQMYISQHRVILLITKQLLIKGFRLDQQKFSDYVLQIPISSNSSDYEIKYTFKYNENYNVLLIHSDKQIYIYDISQFFRKNQEVKKILQNFVYFKHYYVSTYGSYYQDSDFRLWMIQPYSPDLLLLQKFAMDTPLLGSIKYGGIFIAGQKYKNQNVTQIRLQCFSKGSQIDSYILEKNINQTNKFIDQIFIFQQSYQEYMQSYYQWDIILPEQQLIIVDYDSKTISNVECSDKIRLNVFKNLTERKVNEMFIVQKQQLSIKNEQTINGFYYYDDESFYYNDFMLLSSTDSIKSGSFIKFVYLLSGQYFGLIKQKMCYLYQTYSNQFQKPNLLSSIEDCRQLYYCNSQLYFTNLKLKKLYYMFITLKPKIIPFIVLPCLNENKFYFFNQTLFAIYCDLQVNLYTNLNQTIKMLDVIPLSNVVSLMFMEKLLFIGNSEKIQAFNFQIKDSQIQYEIYKNITIKHSSIFFIQTDMQKNNLFYYFLLINENNFQSFELLIDGEINQGNIHRNPDGFACYTDFTQDMTPTSLDLDDIDQNMQLTKSRISIQMLNIYNNNTDSIKDFLKKFKSITHQYTIRFLGQDQYRLSSNYFDVKLFKEISNKDVYIINYHLHFMSLNSSYVENNKQTQNFILQDISLGENNDSYLKFNQLKYVYIDNLKIDGRFKKYTDRLIYFNNIETLILKKIKIINLGKNTSLRKIFVFNNITTILMDSFEIYNCVQLNIESFFFFSQVNTLEIKNLTIFNLSVNQNYESHIRKYIFSIYGAKTILFDTLQIERLKNISLQQSYVSYEEEDNYIDLKNSQITHKYLTIEDCEIQESLIKIKTSQYMIQFSTFNKIIMVQGEGSILNLDSNTEVIIQSSIFINSLSEKGGAIYFYQCASVIIKISKFTNNTAIIQGGAIYTNNTKLNIQGSKITDNKSQIGGGIYYFIQRPNFEIYSKKFRSLQNLVGKYNDQIHNNFAEIFGNNIGSVLNKIIIHDIQSQDLSQMNNTSSNFIQIENFRSGDVLVFEFSIQDEEENTVRYDINKFDQYSQEIQQFLSELAIQVSPENDQNVELSNQVICNYRDFNKTLLRFKSSELKIIYKPSQSITLQIRSNNIISADLIIKVEIKFRKCVVGEVFGKRGELIECIPCPKGFYSLILPQDNKQNDCRPCPESAYECYKKVILLKEGYWRNSNDTDDILYCKNNPSNCQGSKEGNINYCKEGHIGLLCESCDSLGQVWKQKYMRRKKFQCLSCNEISEYTFILPLVFVILFLLAYIIISISQAIKVSKGFTYAYYFKKTGIVNIGTSAIKDFSPFYFKQLMHYMQIASLINQYDFEIPDILKFIPMVISLPIENVEYTFDCVLNNMHQKIPVVFKRALWSLMIPIMYGFTLLIVYFILVLCIKKLKHNKFFAFNGLFFMLIFLESDVISRLVSIISCRKIGQKSFTQNDSSYECYTDEHIQYSLYIVLPGLLVWTVFIPFVILRALVQNKNNLDSLFVRFKFGFLYQEFKSKYYYWEFVKSYKKIIIVILHRLYYDLMQFYSVVICGIVLLYSVVLTKVQPYQQIQFNNLDNILMQVIIILILLNIVIKDTPLEWLEQLGSILAALIYNSVIILFILQIISSKLNAHFFKESYYVKVFLKQNIPFLCDCISLKKPINIIRVHKNWQKVKNAIKLKSWLNNNLHIQTSIEIKKSKIDKKTSPLNKNKKKQNNLHLEQQSSQMKLKSMNITNFNDKSERILSFNSSVDIDFNNFQSPISQEKIQENNKDQEVKNSQNYLMINEVNNPFSSSSLNNFSKICFLSKEKTNKKKVSIQCIDSNEKQGIILGKEAVKVLESLSDSSYSSSDSSQQLEDEEQETNTQQQQNIDQNQFYEQKVNLINYQKNQKNQNENQDIYDQIQQHTTSLKNKNMSILLLNSLNKGNQIRRQSSCPNLSNDMNKNVNSDFTQKLIEQFSSLNFSTRIRLFSNLCNSIKQNERSKFNQNINFDNKFSEINTNNKFNFRDYSISETFYNQSKNESQQILFQKNINNSIDQQNNLQNLIDHSNITIKNQLNIKQSRTNQINDCNEEFNQLNNNIIQNEILYNREQTSLKQHDQKLIMQSFQEQINETSHSELSQESYYIDNQNPKDGVSNIPRPSEPLRK